MIFVHYTWRVAQAKVKNPWPCCSLFNKHFSSLTIFFSFTSDSVTKVKIDVFSCYPLASVSNSLFFLSSQSSVSVPEERSIADGGGRAGSWPSKHRRPNCQRRHRHAVSDLCSTYTDSFFFFFFLEHEMTPSSSHPIYKRFQVCRLGLLTPLPLCFSSSLQTASSADERGDAGSRGAHGSTRSIPQQQPHWAAV